MSVEPIGVATLLLALICVLLGRRAVLIAFIPMTLFGAATVVLLGAGNIQPGHIFLAFATCEVVTRRDELAAALRTLRPGQPAFWLLCLALYGAASAYLAPRLFAELTQVVPLGSSQYPDTGFTVPLASASGNVTQSIYLVANLFCFVVVSALASRPGGFDAVVKGLLIFAAGNVAFALLDIGTYATGTQDLLAFMRNAQYTLHIDVEFNGLKRIVGSFTEASSFARSTLGVFGLTGTMWLCGYRPALTGTLAAASLLLVLFSTSSTGLVGAPVMLALLYATALARCGLQQNARFSTAAVLFAPPLIAAVVLIVLFDERLTVAIRDYLDLLVFNKSGSDSGLQRASWNLAGMQNFYDSFGLGVGLGSARASNFVVALLANVGVPGTIFYSLFLLYSFHGRGAPRHYETDMRLAARNACLGLLFGDLLVSPAVDQGLLFYILVAIAAARPERHTFGASIPLLRPELRRAT